MMDAPRPPAWPKACLFDLDGTLIDSLPDLADALDGFFGAEGHPPLGATRIATMIGRGVENLVQRGYAAHGLEVDGPALAERAQAFRAVYEPRATRLTTLFPHVLETVERLARFGVAMAVCTNKPTAVSREIVAHFGLSAHLPVVVGGDFGPPKKPAPDLVLAALAGLGVAAADALFVGDSAADVGAARAAGVRVVVVPYGYTPVAAADLGADMVIDDFRALPALFGTVAAGSGRGAP